MRGPEVRIVQEALNTNGLANLRDGVYGPFTEALVKKFQERQGLRPDGVVGPATRQAMGL
jgi:peptidoglycan hydrolase-like protein with peptidoglycan-binding domain